MEASNEIYYYNSIIVQHQNTLCYRWLLLAYLYYDWRCILMNIFTMACTVIILQWSWINDN